MAHYKTMFDAGANAEYMFAADLDGEEFTLEIESVAVGELTGENNRRTKKPAIKFVKARKKLAINKTNGKIIAKLYGPDTDAWVGKRITIYPTTTNFGGETVECIRVRPSAPALAQRDTKPANTTSAPAAATTPTTTTLPPADLTPDEIAELERQEREEFARG